MKRAMMGMPIWTANWEILAISAVKEPVLSGLHKMGESVPPHGSAFSQMDERKIFTASAKANIGNFLIIFFIMS